MSDFAQKYRKIILFVPIYVVSVVCIIGQVMCMCPRNYALDMVKLLLIPFTLPFFILPDAMGDVVFVLGVYIFVLISLILKFYDKVISPKLKLRGVSDKILVYAPYSLLIYLMLVVIVAYGYTTTYKMSVGDAVYTESDIPDMEVYHQQCDALCDKYIDSDFNPQEPLAYCEKYYEIDLNKNGNISGEVGMLNAFGVSEDRVYCFNIKECSWGPSRNTRLTLEKCKDIMCDVYTEQYKNETLAEELIKRNIPFGESTEPYHEDLLVLDMNGKPILDREGKVASTASWWIDNFQDVDCSGE